MADISLVVNPSEPYLKYESWERTRAAGDIRFVSYNPYFQDFDTGQVGKWLNSPVSEDFWREPNTGVVMLKPSPMRADYRTDHEWLAFHIAELDVRKSAKLHATHMATQHGVGLPAGMLSVYHAAPVSPSDVIDALVVITMLAIFAAAYPDDMLIWAAETTSNLYINEGWSVDVLPSGTFVQRVGTITGISFGDRFILAVRANGSAELWECGNQARTNTNWVMRARFTYAQAGIDHNKPFTITCIPWGYSYLTFTFSQATQENFGSRGKATSQPTSSFLYDMAANPDFKRSFNSTLNQYVKTDAAPLRVGLTRSSQQVHFTMNRVRYAREATMHFMETVPDIRPQGAPTGFMDGFYGQKPTPSARAAFYGQETSAENENGLTYDPARDTQAVTHLTFDSDEFQVYTPELWSYDFAVPEVIGTTPGAPREWSRGWRYIRFTVSGEPDGGRAEFNLARNDEFEMLLKHDGALHLKLMDALVWDGYVDDHKPVLNTPSVLMTDKLTADDHWVRLNKHAIMDAAKVDDKNVYDVICKLIRICGYPQSNIITSDADKAILQSMDIAKWQATSFFKTFNDDAKVGEAIRDIIKFYGVQGRDVIRVRRHAGQWFFYLSPRYDITVNPDVVFVLSANAYFGAGATDEQRWRPMSGLPMYRIFSDPEWTISRPQCTGLRVYGAVGSQGDAPAMGGSFAMTEATDTGGGGESAIPHPDTRMVMDGTYVDHVGFDEMEAITLPQSTVVSDVAELWRVARQRYKIMKTLPRKLSFDAEYQPEQDVDKFAMVVGIAPDGSAVCYGVYRIDHIDTEFREDWTDHWDHVASPRAPANLRHLWRGNFTMSWAGMPSDDVINGLFTGCEAFTRTWLPPSVIL